MTHWIVLWLLVEGVLFLLAGVATQSDELVLIGWAFLIAAVLLADNDPDTSPREGWRRFCCQYLRLHRGPAETWGPYIYTRCRYCDRLVNPYRRRLMETIERKNDEPPI